LDLSNIKAIIAKGVGLADIPGWLRECHNLKVLKLDHNSISAIQREELPPWLTHLDLWKNVLKAIDISSLNALTHLNLASNYIR
jgi:Leucine-rich repeat (LRR) protein